MNYYFIKIEERNGEQEYTTKLVRQLEKKLSHNELTQWVEDNIVKTWYDDDDVEKVDDKFEFFGGCIIVEIGSIEEISEKDFKVLKQYL